MYMNMSIVMTMNIYITKANEEWLRTQTSMSGTINSLLDAQRGAGTLKATLPETNYGMRAPVSSTDVEKIIDALGGKTVQDPSPVEQSVLDSLPVTPGCCLLKTPCKHWIWSGEQMAYVNTISGEIREVDV